MPSVTISSRAAVGFVVLASAMLLTLFFFLDKWLAYVLVRGVCVCMPLLPLGKGMRSSGSRGEEAAFWLGFALLCRALRHARGRLLPGVHACLAVPLVRCLSPAPLPPPGAAAGDPVCAGRLAGLRHDFLRGAQPAQLLAVAWQLHPAAGCGRGARQRRDCGRAGGRPVRHVGRVAQRGVELAAAGGAGTWCSVWALPSALPSLSRVERSGSARCSCCRPAGARLPIPSCSLRSTLPPPPQPCRTSWASASCWSSSSSSSCPTSRSPPPCSASPLCTVRGLGARGRGDSCTAPEPKCLPIPRLPSHTCAPRTSFLPARHSHKLCCSLPARLADVWWVFIQPIVTGGESVMVEVATGGASHEQLPMVLRVPHHVLGTNPAFALLGLGGRQRRGRLGWPTGLAGLGNPAASFRDACPCICFPMLRRPRPFQPCPAPASAHVPQGTWCCLACWPSSAAAST